MSTAFFYICSALSILGAVCVISLSKPTRALLALILTMFSLSGLYILLGAPFVGLTLLIVYAGAVLVLFLFVIMLQGIGAKDIPLRERFHPGFLPAAIIVGCGFIVIFLTVLLQSHFKNTTGFEGTTAMIGRALFNQYLLPFEMISLLLLLGIFAAISLAKKDEAA